MEHACATQLIARASPSCGHLHAPTSETRTAAFKAAVRKLQPRCLPTGAPGQNPQTTECACSCAGVHPAVNERHGKTSLYHSLAVRRLHWHEELNKNSVDVRSDFWHLLPFLLLLVLLLHCNSCSLFPPSYPPNQLYYNLAHLFSQPHRNNCKINKMTSK